MTRTIIHVDLDAFFCSIEEQRDPSLHGKPFAVGGQPDKRGVVASCSYAARRFGVRSAMSMARARALCPQLIIVPTRHSEYRAASAQVMAQLRVATSQIEQISIDEAFLDVTEMLGPQFPKRSGRSIAKYLQRTIASELGLSCSVGVASNKMVAKIATDFGKAAVANGLSPQAICVVEPGDEEAFLAPLPASALWGVGPKMEAQLTALGIETIGDIARIPVEQFVRRFGKHGYELSQHARGIDKREIVTHRETKSISTENTFVRDVDDWDVLYETICEQAADIAGQLRKHDLRGTTIRIKLRWSDFTTSTRQTTLPIATADENLIRDTAVKLLRQLWKEGETVRLLGVGIAGFDPGYQLRLWSSLENAQQEEQDEEQANEEAVIESEEEEDDSEFEMPDTGDGAEPASGEAQGYRLVADVEKMEPLAKSEKLARAQQAMAEIKEKYGQGSVRLGAGE